MSPFADSKASTFVHSTGRMLKFDSAALNTPCDSPRPSIFRIPRPGRKIFPEAVAPGRAAGSARRGIRDSPDDRRLGPVDSAANGPVVSADRVNSQF